LRKNSRGGKGVVGVYVTYHVEGLNVNALLNHLKRKGFTLYNVKKLSEKLATVTVNFKESQNFFAIADKMCYNVKKVRLSGWGYPLYALYSSIGVLIGGLVFLLLLFIMNDYIFSIDFSGSGSIYKNQVLEFLSANGVKEYSRFSNVDLERLEDLTLADNSRLSFVSMKKRGNRLKVELILSSEKVNTLDGNVFALYSDVSGKVESIKVYRGAAVVKVGDSVKKGDLLVSGDVIVKDQPLKTNVLCSVTVIADSFIEYYSALDGQEQVAALFAEAKMDDKEIISTNVIKTEKENGYLYAVNVKYRRVLFAG
jgi:similar to stage IV sporulation protein